MCRRRQIERILALGVVRLEHGRDPGPHEGSLRELRIGPCRVAADLDHAYVAGRSPGGTTRPTSLIVDPCLISKAASRETRRVASVDPLAHPRASGEPTLVSPAARARRRPELPGPRTR